MRSCLNQASESNNNSFISYIYNLFFGTRNKKVHLENTCDAEIAEKIISAIFSNKQDSEIMDLLKDADINQIESGGFTFLGIASGAQKHSIVKLIINEGADVNQIDLNGFTALMLASGQGHEDIVSILLDAKAEINELGPENETALMIAVKNRCLSVAKSLVTRGANANIANINGETPLMMAARNGDATMVEVLINNGAEIKDGAALKIASESIINTGLKDSTRSGCKLVVTLLSQNTQVTDQDNAQASHVPNDEVNNHSDLNLEEESENKELNEVKQEEEGQHKDTISPILKAIYSFKYLLESYMQKEFMNSSPVTSLIKEEKIKESIINHEVDLSFLKDTEDLTFNKDSKDNIEDYPVDKVKIKMDHNQYTPDLSFIASVPVVAIIVAFSSVPMQTSLDNVNELLLGNMIDI